MDKPNNGIIILNKKSDLEKIKQFCTWILDNTDYTTIHIYCQEKLQEEVVTIVEYIRGINLSTFIDIHVNSANLFDNFILNFCSFNRVRITQEVTDFSDTIYQNCYDVNLIISEDNVTELFNVYNKIKETSAEYIHFETDNSNIPDKILQQQCKLICEDILNTFKAGQSPKCIPDNLLNILFNIVLSNNTEEIREEFTYQYLLDFFDEHIKNHVTLSDSGKIYSGDLHKNILPVELLISNKDEIPDKFTEYTEIDNKSCRCNNCICKYSCYAGSMESNLIYNKQVNIPLDNYCKLTSILSKAFSKVVKVLDNEKNQTFKNFLYKYYLNKFRK